MLGDARLAELAEAISDGTPIDWEKVGSSESDAERAILRELKVVADIVQLHRDLPRPSSPVTGRETIAESGMATGQWEEHWGHLRLLDKIGHGSFGDVYRAWDTRLDREVALKLLRQPQSRSAAAGTVIEEGRLLARVRHPNVVTVFGAERIDGRIGVWMEFIRGRTLEQHIRERGVFSAREAMLISSDLCRALSAVHKAGLLHRDLKAQNVMREDGGRIVLMDFGTGREQGQAGPEPVRDFAGTPLYLAPEILRGKPATAQSDVYSLGVLLFRLVTGEYPVAGRTLRDVSAAHDRGAHVAVTDLRPDLPDAFVQILHRALATDPKARFETAGAMEHALSRALAEETPGPEQLLLHAEATPAPTPVPTPATVPPRRRVPTWVTVAAGLLVLVAAGVALYRWLTPERPRIAVMPFENRTGDPKFDLIAEGIPDAMFANLSTIGGLDLIATSSSRRHKDSKKSPREIGVELNADYLVYGSIWSEKDLVRLTVNVIRADTEEQRSTRHFDSQNVGGILAYQGDVARRIADAIAVSLSPEEVRRFQAMPTPKGDVQLWVNAVTRMRDASPADMEAAVILLENYNRSDSSYAPAYALLANAYIRLAGRSTLFPHAESVRRARQAAETALKLNPDQADAYSALARVRFGFEWDWPGAEDAFRRALRLSPSLAEVSGSFAMFLAALRRFDEALAQARRARDLDPGAPIRTTGIAAIWYYAGHYDDALAEIESALAREPKLVTGHFTRGLVLSALERYPEAIASIEQSMLLENSRDPARLADLARIHALAGDRVKAETIFAEMIDAASKGTALSPEKIAFVHGALGHRDLAFEFLRTAMREKAYGLAWLRVDPRWNPIRDDPRFAQIVAEMGLSR